MVILFVKNSDAQLLSQVSGTKIQN
jgi:hypothetical protein